MNISYLKIRKTVYYLFILFCLLSIIKADDQKIPIASTIGNIIDLGSNYIITKIKGTKNTNNKDYNYLLGIFEASTDISFSDGFPIAMLKEDVVTNQNSIGIDTKCLKAYRYIRYIPPNQNNAKLDNIEVYGNTGTTGTPLLITDLPLMVIKTENSKEPDSREEYINCKVIIINENGVNVNSNAKIRIRGHSTSSFEKKPWKIKFDDSVKVLDIDKKYKNWAVLANHFDKSLLRNDLAFEISRNIGLPFTPRCRFLDVIMNGNFRGNYYICDQIEIKKGRVDILAANDKNEPDITGGYLIEIDERAVEEEEKFFLTEKGLVGEIKEPDSDDITKEEENYIKLYLNEMEKQVYIGNLDYLDLHTFYRYFIMQEFCGDIDIIYSSFHLTKRRGDIKLYFGPVWDYDRAFDSDSVIFPTNQKPMFTFYYGDTAGTCRDFIRTILLTNNTISHINKTWYELKESVLNLTHLEKYIKDTSNKILESAKLNYYKWFGATIENAKNEYESNVSIVTDYVKQRFDRLTYLINTYDFTGEQLKINLGFLLLLILFVL